MRRSYRNTNINVKAIKVYVVSGGDTHKLEAVIPVEGEEPIVFRQCGTDREKLVKRAQEVIDFVLPDEEEDEMDEDTVEWLVDGVHGIVNAEELDAEARAYFDMY